MSRALQWLVPGLGLKRWLILLVLGGIFTSVGVVYLVTQVYRAKGAPDIFFFLTFQFLPRVWRGIIFFGGGAALTLFSLWRLNRAVDAVLPQGSEGLVETIHRRRRLTRGPKIVAIGGGTGLASLLRGLKEHTSNITAIVTVADDGGSSGRLRRELGVLPPGDFRQCIAALAEAEPLMTQLFEYRFGNGGSLQGHSFGNLFISALSTITGSFESALKESSRILAVRGRILPSTLEDVTLYADLADERVVEGESQLPLGGAPISRVYLRPAWAQAYGEAVQAIMEADLVVLGPGSLYTSILPNLLVGGIAEALRTTRAPVLFVCNVATQPGETDGYSPQDHIDAVIRHAGEGIIDAMLVATRQHPFPPEWGVSPVVLDPAQWSNGTVRIIGADVVDAHRPTRHDPQSLGRALVSHPPLFTSR